MAEQKGPEHETPAEEPGKETPVPIEKLKKTRAPLTRTQAEERARLKAEKALTEAQEALEDAKTEVEREREAREKAEQARAEAESALAEARQAVEKAKTEAKAAFSRAQAEEKVRLKAEKALTHAQEELKAAKAEVEEAREARDKAEKAAADIQEALVTAHEEVEKERQARIKAEQGWAEAEGALAEAKKAMTAEAKPTITPVPPPARVEAPTQEFPRPESRLIVSDVRVFRMTPDVMTLTLGSDEAFLVQARFQLQGPEAPSLAAQESSYEIKVYAKEMTRGRSRLLAAHRAKLVKDVLEYDPKIQAPGLSTGLYRLSTLVTLHAKEPLRIGFRYAGTRDVVKMTGYREGPILQVAGVQSPIRPPTLREVLPSR